MITSTMSGKGSLEQANPSGDLGGGEIGRLRDRSGSYKAGIKSEEVVGKRRAEEELISERKRVEKLEEMRNRMSPIKGKDLSEEWATHWGGGSGAGGSSGGKNEEGGGQEEAKGGGLQAEELRKILKEELNAKLDPINSRLDQMEETSKKK